jgi:hypothetical protein
VPTDVWAHRSYPVLSINAPTECHQRPGEPEGVRYSNHRWSRSASNARFSRARTAEASRSPTRGSGRAAAGHHPLLTWKSSCIVHNQLALYLDETPTHTVSSITSLLHSEATRVTIGDAGTGSPRRLLYAPYFHIYITGQGRIYEIGLYQWGSSQSGGGNYTPTSYRWEYRPVTTPVWEVVGRSATYSRYVTTYDPDFELRLTAKINDVESVRVRLIEVACQTEFCPEGTVGADAEDLST